MARFTLAGAITFIQGFVAAHRRSRTVERCLAASPVDLQRYRDVLLGLPGETRMVFVLHASDGLDIAEIAPRLSISTRQVEAHLAAAILALSRKLDGRSD
jgi:DNA-directed RNA polymerase specialized sigma24 family protein